MTDKGEIVDFLAREFPDSRWSVVEVGNRSATVKFDIGARDLRPGGTVAGPVLMTVADIALYAAILGEIGIVPLTVTTSLTINFLRKPSAGKNILGLCKLLKVGRTLAVGEVGLHSEGSSELVAHAVGTYAIPRG